MIGHMDKNSGDHSNDNMMKGTNTNGHLGGHDEHNEDAGLFLAGEMARHILYDN